jgi:catechol 2,3-dioxygenase-like lactoylglutathione lyase family enzyme
MTTVRYFLLPGWSVRPRSQGHHATGENRCAGDVETGATASSSEMTAPPGAATEGNQPMDWKLEVVVIPVTDIDRAKSFYTGKLGFHLDADTTPTETMRVVHMTPPGSGCSVVIGPKVVPAGTDLGSSASLQLVVPDIEAARTELADRGVEISPVQTMDPRDGGKFAFFTDPDGNNWAIQEVREYVGAELSS